MRTGDLRSAVRFLLSKGYDYGYLQHQRRAQLRFQRNRKRYSAAYDLLSAEPERGGRRADCGELPAAYSRG